MGVDAYMEQILFFVIFLVSSMLLGAMLFFSFLVAPITFIKLEAKPAGQFIRSIFPHYYLIVIIFSLIAAILLALVQHTSAVMMFFITLSGLFSRQILIPKVNSYRDAEIAGDTSAKSKFDNLHRLSVGINGGQIILLIVSIVNIQQMGLRVT
jgi:hypothetical protein